MGLIDLEDGKALTIADALKHFGQINNLDLNKMVGIGSDGAAVMVGRRAGVSKFLH